MTKNLELFLEDPSARAASEGMLRVSSRGRASTLCDIRGQAGSPARQWFNPRVRELTRTRIPGHPWSIPPLYGGFIFCEALIPALRVACTADEQAFGIFPGLPAELGSPHNSGKVNPRSAVSGPARYAIQVPSCPSAGSRACAARPPCSARARDFPLQNRPPRPYKQLCRRGSLSQRPRWP